MLNLLLSTGIKICYQFLYVFSVEGLAVNPIALRMAKTLWSFGHSECNRVNSQESLANKSYDMVSSSLLVHINQVC